MGGVVNVIASLGRQTLALLGELDVKLPAHLSEPFGRLAALEAICAEIGAPPTAGAFEDYRQTLLPCQAAQR